MPLFWRSMRAAALAALALMVTLTLAAPVSLAQEDDTTVMIQGSLQLEALVRAIRDAYVEAAPDADVQIDPQGQSAGFDALCSGETDLVMATAPIADEVIARCAGQGQDHKDGEGSIKYFYLIAVFIGIGLNDFALKFFKVWRHENEEPYFILFIFLSAFLYTSIYIIIKRIKIKRNTALLGLTLGVPNVLTTVFLLSALALLPAIIVFPIMNVGIILLTTVMAFIIWKEKLNRWGVLALTSGMIAILFLSLGR